MDIRFITLTWDRTVVKEKLKMKNKEYKDTRESMKFIIKGSKKMWDKYLERLKKAKEKGCTTCGCCK